MKVGIYCDSVLVMMCP